MHKLSLPCSKVDPFVRRFRRFALARWDVPDELACRSAAFFMWVCLKAEAFPFPTALKNK